MCSACWAGTFVPDAVHDLGESPVPGSPVRAMPGTQRPLPLVVHGGVDLVEVVLAGVGHLVVGALNLVEGRKVLVHGVVVQVGLGRHEDVVEEVGLVLGRGEESHGCGVGRLVRSADQHLERGYLCSPFVHDVFGCVKVLLNRVVDGRALVLGDVVVVQVVLGRGVKLAGQVLLVR